MGGLTRSELDELRTQLKQHYQETLREIREELEQTGNTHPIDLLNHEPADSGDESLAHQLAEINVATLEHQVRDVRDIEGAFRRLREGMYGVCIDCEADITLARLRAYPTAKRCIACQQIHERRLAQEGSADR